jgi:ATP-dependent Clp protease ATP-binding subunit ClpA
VTFGNADIQGPHMRLDKLTSKFQLALADAQSLAIGQDHQFIEPAHLMVALLDQQGGTVRGLLTKAGANVNLLRSQLGDAIDRLPKVEGAGGEVHFSNDLGKLFNIATISTYRVNSSCLQHWTTARRSGICSSRQARCAVRSRKQSTICAAVSRSMTRMRKIRARHSSAIRSI